MNKHTKLRRATKLDSEKGTNNLNLNKLPISIAIATVLTGGASSELYAQEQNQAAVEEQAIEEQIVTGIRSSLRKSIDRKRNAKGVVDSINAIDIGAFPDTNLAESLQRITGVSIDRQRGEGSRITVRGWGPDFNLVLFNGRQMPTQSGAGRSFDFGNIASEGISAVDVIKSGDSTLPTGGVGATINVISTKPLDNLGFHASGGIKFVNDTSTDRGDSVTPEISGIYSNTFLDDKLGVSLSASFQERHTGVNSASVSSDSNRGLRSFAFDDTSLLPDNDAQINRPTSGIYSTFYKSSTAYEIAEFERKRTNGQLTVQYQVTDDIRATLDYTYAEQDVVRRYSNLSAWYEGGTPSSSWKQFGEGGNSIWSPTVYSESYGTDLKDFSMGFGFDATINENKSLGFNLEWAVTERLNLELDYHNSSAEYRPNSPYGSRSLLSTSTHTRHQSRTFFSQHGTDTPLELPVLQIGLTEPLNKDNVKIAGSNFRNDHNLMKMNQTAIKGSFEIDDSSSVDFGIQLTSANNIARSAQVQRGTWGGVGEDGDISDLLQETSIAGKFDQLSGGDDPRLHTQYYIADADALIARAEELIVKYDNTATIDVNEGLEAISPSDELEGGLGTCGTGFCPSDNYTNSANTTEDTTSIYAQYTRNDELFGFEYDIQFGLRYEETEVKSPASFVIYDTAAWYIDNTISLRGKEDAEGKPVTTDTFQEGSYNYLLPNLNIKVNLTDNLVGRGAISKTIARAGYNQLLGSVDIGSRANDGVGSGDAGNPNLLPYESINLDGILEYYFGTDNYISLGLFYKRVSNFILQRVDENVVLPEFPDLTHPFNGEDSYYAQAITVLNNEGNSSPTNGEIRGYIFKNFEGQVGVTVNKDTDGNITGGTIEGIASNGPVLFNVNRFTNKGDDAYTQGIEFAVHYNFGESGFGGIFNITLLDTDVTYDNSSIADQSPLPGLSDTLNLVGFYDKNGIQARLAYNWRDSFYNGGGYGGYPIYEKAYDQVDMSASYEIIDDLVVYVEGLNILNSTGGSYGRTKLEIVSASQTGPRYHLGVRYKF